MEFLNLLDYLNYPQKRSKVEQVLRFVPMLQEVQQEKDECF